MLSLLTTRTNLICSIPKGCHEYPRFGEGLCRRNPNVIAHVALGKAYFAHVAI